VQAPGVSFFRIRRGKRTRPVIPLARISTGAARKKPSRTRILAPRRIVPPAPQAAVRLNLLFACCLALLPALSVAGDSTDDAFDALLSLPQAQPEQGEWNHAAPEGFDSQDGDEAALIAWLDACRDEGADFGELRHQGSLLGQQIECSRAGQSYRLDAPRFVLAAVLAKGAQADESAVIGVAE